MFEVTGAMPSQKYIVTDKKTNRGGMSVVVPSSGDQVQVWHHPATHSLSDPSSNRTMPSNPPEIYNKLKSLSTLVTSLTICLTAESLSPHCIIFPGDVYTETLRPHGHGLRSSSLGPDWLRDKFRVTMWRCVWCTGGPGHRLPIIHGHRRARLIYTRMFHKYSCSSLWSNIDVKIGKVDVNWIKVKISEIIHITWKRILK